ncbi:MAG: hypothetical protein ACT4QF_02270 [Sporichthyaceae bacterium]
MNLFAEDLAREGMRSRLREAGEARLVAAARRARQAERMAQRAERAQHRAAKAWARVAQ